MTERLVTGSDTAAALGINSAPILALCRRLIANFKEAAE
jgi:hypothetical protein